MKTLEIQYKVIVMLVLALGLSSVTGIAPVAVEGRSVLAGEYASALEKQYEDALPVKQFAMSAWTAFTLLTFGEASPGVVIGESEWLFTDEEFIADHDADVIYQSNLDFVQDVHEQLSARGIELAIVPVPAKARVYANHANQQPAPAHQNLYQQFLADMHQREVRVVDTLPALMSGKTNRAMFLKTDTHWTPAGAAVVAAAVAGVLEGEHLLGDELWTSTFNAAQVIAGDLTAFVELTSWFKPLSPAEEVIPQFVASTRTEIDLFAELTSPEVALIGTSYSANPTFHFEGFLKSAAHSDVVNFAEEGVGPFKPMQAFLRDISGEKGASPFRLVVWEIPERYLIHRDSLVVNL